MTDPNLLTITADGTFWFRDPLSMMEHTLQIKIPTGVTATVVAIVSTNIDDADDTGPLLVNGEQVSFDASGSYRSHYIDVSGHKYVGLTVSGLAGGPVIGKIRKHDS